MPMRHRSVGLCIVLTIITCGIYGIYWFICLNDSVNEVTYRPGDSVTTGGMAFLFGLLSCGIYYIYWNYKMGDKLDQARAERGVPTGSLAILYLVLSIVGLSIVSSALMQSELNHYTPAGDYGPEQDDDRF